MKHIKKHPINDKAQKLSKDMKKQDLVKPKTDKKLDADDHLSDPKISKRYVKPSNKKLSSEKHLAGKKAKKVSENLDPMGSWKTEEGCDYLQMAEDYLKSGDAFTTHALGIRDFAKYLQENCK